MRVTVLTGPGAVELRDYPTPSPGAGEVLVEVGYCGLCTMERRLFLGPSSAYPVAPGHEVAGRLSAVGAGVVLPAGVQVGDVVAVDLLTRCGSCAQCRRGRSALCRSPQGGRLAAGTAAWGAGLADTVVAKAAGVWPTGAAPLAHAALCEPLACVVHSLRLAGLRAGDRLAIVGAGFMGRLHAAAGRLAAAASVGVVDVEPHRLDDARAAGADWSATPETAGRPGTQDVVVVTTGAPGTVELAVDLCDDGGVVVLFGATDPQHTAGVRPDRVHHHELAVVGVYSHEPQDWRHAAGLLASGALSADLDRLLTAVHPLDEVGTALDRAAHHPAYRLLVGRGGP